MKSFSLVPTSEGLRLEFKITWGLRAGYGPSGRIYDLEEAIRAAHRWMRAGLARVEQAVRTRLSAGGSRIRTLSPTRGSGALSAIKSNQIPKAMSWQTNGRRRPCFRKSSSHPTPRWREMDSNLYGAFPVKSVVLGLFDSSSFGGVSR